MLNVAVVGATGYVGAELLRLLFVHPSVKVACVTSERFAGEPLCNKLPFLHKRYNLTLETYGADKIASIADIVFVALAHGKAMAPVHQLVQLGRRVIDLSADYRLPSAGLYQKWYRTRHLHPKLLRKAVYGLTEVHRADIANGGLIANPGCYPTGALLAIYPFVKEGLLDGNREIIIDAKSGISGAGSVATARTHFPDTHENVTAYDVGVHRHIPEIERGMMRMGIKVKTVFTPYLTPINRGILTTVYLPLVKSISRATVASLLKVYKNEPFIRERVEAPSLSAVRGSNFCDIFAFLAASGKTAVVMSAIDNLGKGAAGQAIQNMNVMMGWEETLGLAAPGFYP